MRVENTRRLYTGLPGIHTVLVSNSAASVMRGLLGQAICPKFMNGRKVVSRTCIRPYDVSGGAFVVVTIYLS